MPKLKTLPPRYLPMDFETVQELNEYLLTVMSSFRRDLLLNPVEQGQAMQALFRKLSDFISEQNVPEVDLAILSISEFKDIAAHSPEGKMIAELKAIFAVHEENIGQIKASRVSASAVSASAVSASAVSASADSFHYFSLPKRAPHAPLGAGLWKVKQLFSFQEIDEQMLATIAALKQKATTLEPGQEVDTEGFVGLLQQLEVYVRQEQPITVELINTEAEKIDSLKTVLPSSPVHGLLEELKAFCLENSANVSSMALS